MRRDDTFSIIVHIKGTVTQAISKHKKIELAPNMFNILKMSKGDVFRIFDFAREVS